MFHHRQHCGSEDRYHDPLLHFLPLYKIKDIMCFGVGPQVIRPRPLWEGKRCLFLHKEQQVKHSQLWCCVVDFNNNKCTNHDVHFSVLQAVKQTRPFATMLPYLSNIGVLIAVYKITSRQCDLDWCKLMLLNITSCLGILGTIHPGEVTGWLWYAKSAVWRNVVCYKYRVQLINFGRLRCFSD